ncbi:radical SAM protein [Desulfitobacterium chlororespirans]|uniref:Biotin synthase n=1 Tax=Desulfitobacterium chlororespirans DSM 11544 TaxID=1121395 RepID=A0A1M7SHM0_9FIRM|nr:radical SAM protein [Desulfitobacterium chlororespirans]SHN57969.1 biotin synthase [Desulfitobacterium chlororespirans DSM 11544]
MDKKIDQIIRKAMDGGEINEEELLGLLSVHYLSEESFMIRYASRKMSEAASGGKAEVHAQVGIDNGPCPKNCGFCSFAAVNKVFPQPMVRSLEEVIASCLTLEADGANAVYLMETAKYPFADFIRMAKEVKAALKPETTFIANTDDFDDDGARALKKAGFHGIYHVVHMGEGTTTAIHPRTRLKTIAAAQKTGLLIGTAVEPIGPEHTKEEIIEKTMLIREIRPVHAGAGGRVHISGSVLEDHGVLTSAQTSLIIAAVKLAVGYRVRGHCGGLEIGAMTGVNLTWAEVGSNPRDTETNTVKGSTVKLRQDELREAGWEVLEGPSAMFGTTA